MKIIQLVYALGPGGAEHVALDLANELHRRGHEVIVCAILDLSINIDLYTYGIKYLSDGVKYVNLKQKKGFNLKKLKTIEEFVKSESPDVVHLHLNILPYIFNLSLRNKQIKFVYTFHNLANKASGPILQIPINYIFFKYNKITPITISKECDLSYKKYYHLNNSICIYNGRSILFPTKRYDSVKEKINKLKKTDKTKVFIHLGRFHPQKNQILLIHAFNELYKRGYDFILLILGLKFDQDETLFLRNMACERISFWGQQDNVSDYLFCSDAFCLSSLYEGLPISLLEAISTGCVPICTPVGGIPDIIQDGKTGYLSKTVELHDYIDAILNYFNNPNQIQRNSLIKYFKEKFSIEKTVDKYLQVYESKQDYSTKI